MKLYSSDKKIILEKILDIFDINAEKAQVLVDDLEKILRGEDENFIYKLKYLIYFRNDIQFTTNILTCAVDIFSLLITNPKYNDNKKELKAFYLKLLDILFIERCRYSKKIEKRRNTVQKVLQHMSGQLNQSLEMQQLMLANISHEMRTSLNAISGYIALVDKKDILINEDKNYLDKATQATSTLKALVSDILDVSKINSGQMEIREEPFWLDEMLLKSIDNIALDLDKKNIMFKTDIDWFPQKLIGDSQHIMEILTNLLSNAIKYTDSGVVHLTVSKSKESNKSLKILFKIADTGIGMTENQIEKIFDPYSRFVVEKKGVGLGLYITSKLAYKLGGNLSVKSKLAEGSTFSFSLKIKEDPNCIVNMENKVLCFFNNTKETDIYKRKFNLIKQFGAEIKYFNDEQKFVNYLLTLNSDVPDIISIMTHNEEYLKYDALINYLKNNKKFKKTYFIAEKIESRLPLNYFDKINERFTPISVYINFLKEIDKEIEVNLLVKKEISILAVDDIETNLEILKLFISNKYPNVIIDLAMGGYEAIGMYKTKTYDIIFMDLKMPGLNGFKVYEKLEAIKKPPATYALTADVYKETYDKVMQAGFRGLLEKPLQLDILFKAIEKEIDEKYN